MADKDIMSRKGIVELDGHLNDLAGSDLLYDEVVSEHLTRFDFYYDIYIYMLT